MKMVANIIEDIRGELDGAEEYAKKAAEYKEKDRSLSSTYSTPREKKFRKGCRLYTTGNTKK